MHRLRVPSDPTIFRLFAQDLVFLMSYPTRWLASLMLCLTVPGQGLVAVACCCTGFAAGVSTSFEISSAARTESDHRCCRQPTADSGALLDCGPLKSLSADSALRPGCNHCACLADSESPQAVFVPLAATPTSDSEPLSWPASPNADAEAVFQQILPPLSHNCRQAQLGVWRK